MATIGCFVLSMARQDKIDRYRAIIMGKRKPTILQDLQLKKYKFSFALLCEGFSPLQITQQLIASDLDVNSMAMAYKIVRESMQIFGNAARYHKLGLKSANYERLMKLAKLCEEKGDYATTRLLIKDANELMGLMKDDEEMLDDAQDWMKPEAFMVITDPNQVDAAQKLIEMEIESDDVEFEDVDDEERPEESQTDISDTQTS
jgi:hypothetical protein